MGRKNMACKSNTLTVRAAPSNPSRAFVKCGPVTVPAAIGRSGRSAFKREGDGATPIAGMRVLGGFVRGERVKGLKAGLALRPIAKSLLWCDQPDHPAYNRPVRAPFKPSHEAMCRADGLYDVCLVLDWNITSRVRHRGSAIFFHLIKPGYQPTAGCVAVSLRDMKRLLPHIRKGTTVKVI
jgi:L,D-peptidoglycan transpeptidase YkuD (ErfK/YbiS/YcfS/YnhG family)